MKRLVLLLVTPLIILSAQGQAQHIVDAKRDASAVNLKSMASSMSNGLCAKVAEIRLTDNGGYSTVIVFFHGITAADSFYWAYEPDTAIHKTAIIDVVARAIAIDVPIFVIALMDTTAVLYIDNSSIQMIVEIDTFPIVVATDNPFQIAAPVAFEQDTAWEAAEIANDIRRPVEEMHLSPDGYSLLQKLEGFAPGLYSLNDGGYTIGFGFFVPYNEGYKWSKGVTWDEAAALIQEKVPAYEAQVKEYINVPVTQNEFDALTMLAYNLGGFSKATSIVNDINDQVDFSKLQGDWKRFVHSKAPNVSRGLMKRRKDELEVRESSDYQPSRKIQIYKSRK